MVLIILLYDLLASPPWLDLVLTEQRIHHLAILRIDDKLNKILSQNLNQEIAVSSTAQM